MTYRELFRQHCPELLEKIEQAGNDDVRRPGGVDLDGSVEGCDTVGDALRGAFSWVRTPEGYDFWEFHADRLASIPIDSGE